MAEKLRADLALVRLGLAPSREKAQALIMAGQVYLKEQKILKASEKIEEGAELIVRGHSHPFVGRGALKLDKALRVFQADVKGTVCMDIGANVSQAIIPSHGSGSCGFFQRSCPIGGAA